MSITDDLVARIDAYLALHRMSARAFSLMVGKDHKWLSRLRTGAVTLSSVERAKAILDAADAPSPPRAEPCATARMIRREVVA